MNLFTRDGEKALAQAKVVPFSHEEALETLVFENPDLMGGIFPLKRQIRGGNKSGIPDIIGIDADGKVCVIEVKNVRVDSSIVPQLLQYAIWAEEHPDSIKSMWLECKNPPEGIAPDFDSYDVRLIVVAPSIDPVVAHHAHKINFAVELIEVSRYSVENKELFAVRRIEHVLAKVKPASGQELYDRAYYEENKEKSSVAAFFKAVTWIEALLKDQNWPLETKMNKGYVVFKSGSSQVFGIQWANSKAYALFFKLAEDEAKALSPVDVTNLHYDVQYKHAEFRIKKDEKLENYLPLIKASVEKFVKTS